jgi:hypothetical protein
MYYIYECNNDYKKGVKDHPELLKYIKFYLYDELTLIIVYIDYIKWQLVPIIILVLRKNENIFTSFSKLDDHAPSIYVVPILPSDN